MQTGLLIGLVGRPTCETIDPVTTKAVTTKEPSTTSAPDGPTVTMPNVVSVMLFLSLPALKINLEGESPLLGVYLPQGISFL